MWLQSKIVVVGVVLAGVVLLAGGVGLDLIQERHLLACAAGMAGVVLIVTGVVLNQVALRNKIVGGRNR